MNALDAVYADPKNDAPRLAFGASLASDDPLRELIRLQIARAGGKGGTLAKERRIFDPTRWPDHPVHRLCGAVEHRHTERGFPSRFSPAMPVNATDVAKETKAWPREARNAGWATVREFSAGLADSPAIAELLSRAPLASLERLEAGSVVFAALGEVPLSITEAHIWDAGKRDVAPLRKMATLSRLNFFGYEREYLPTTPIARGLERVRALGVLEGLVSLGIGGYVLGSLVVDALDMFDAMPPRLETLVVHGRDVARATVTRGALVINVSASDVDEVAGALARVDASRVRSVTVALDPAGYFKKKDKPAMIAKLERAVARFGEHAVTG